MDPLLLVKIAAVMLLLDGIWIYLVAGNAFSSMVQNIQGSAMKIRPGGAIVAYAAMILLFSSSRRNPRDGMRFYSGSWRMLSTMAPITR